MLRSVAKLVIFDNASVFANAKVYGNARVFGTTVLRGDDKFGEGVLGDLE